MFRSNSPYVVAFLRYIFSFDHVHTKQILKTNVDVKKQEPTCYWHNLRLTDKTNKKRIQKYFRVLLYNKMECCEMCVFP